MSDITDSERFEAGTDPSDTDQEFHDDALSYEITTAVAAATGTDPLELPPLYERIDSDALDTLVNSVRERRTDVDGGVTFTYAGFEVAVSFDGRFELSPIAQG